MVVALLAGCSDDGSGGEVAPTTARPATSTPDGRGLSAVPDVVADIGPSVVAIGTPDGEGSGIVYDADGIVVTNAHVVGEATEVEVVFADGRTVAGEVLTTDEVVDLAVVRVERGDLPPVQLAPELPRVGSLAIAVGNPLGFENTVTVGVVSALHRQIPGSAQQTPSLVDLIQTDAAISPGNSGGALLDVEGRLIGLNVAYLPPQARAVSIGFAIPSATVAETVEQLLEDGTADHPWLGIVPTPVSPQLADRFDLGADAGVLLGPVEPGGPADDAGLRSGDVLVELEGASLATVEDLLAELRSYAPGEEVELVVIRDGARQELSVTLGSRP